MDRPPDAKHPTSAQLKADINSGATGDKIAVFDPGLSSLGTDDEAAGTPPSTEAIALARRNERRSGFGSNGASTPSGSNRIYLLLPAVALAVVGALIISLRYL